MDRAQPGQNAWLRISVDENFLTFRFQIQGHGAGTLGHEWESGSNVMCCSLPRPTSRARAWPRQLGEHLLHELPAARLVCLPRLHQVAGRVHHAVHRGSEGAPPTPVFILDTVAPPER